MWKSRIEGWFYLIPVMMGIVLFELRYGDW